MDNYRPLKVATLLALLMLILSCQMSWAQEEVEVFDEFSNEPIATRLIGFNFNLLYPRSTFKRNLPEESGLGGGVFLLWQSSPLSPHFLGFDIEYDHLFRDVGFTNGLEERVNSGYVSLTANWRIFPNFRLWLIEPYMEAFAGPNFIFTATSVFDENTGQNIDFGFDQTNVGFEYGIAFGLTVPVVNAWYFDFQVSFSNTSIAQYFVLPEAGIGGFREANSATDHTKFKFGAIYAF